MTTLSSTSKTSSRAYLLSTLALCGGYYVGQIILWVMGLKGIPKIGAVQLMNLAFIYMIGYALIKLLGQTSKPLPYWLLVAGLATIARYVIVCLTDLGDHPVLFVFQRNLIEIFTFGVMAISAVVCGYYTYKKLA
ncbi:MAG: hypothetical protein JST12_11620 [Armatimonadetes bacterium]|nr:hypothetical protein [Armatimonadota bacterium]